MIDIIGIGSGGVSSLCPSALARIESADILVGTKRYQALFPGFKGRRIEIGALKSVIKKILAAGNVPIVVLATGDPGLFGIGEYFTKELGRARVRITPNVSIVQEAFARIKKSWNGVKIISVHGTKAGKDRSVDTAVEEIMRSAKSAVYTDPKNKPSDLARALLKKGADGFKVIVFEALGAKEEKITRGSLSLISQKKFNPLNLTLFFAPEKGEPLSQASLFGLDVTKYKHTNGLITKAEVRAVTLSKLSITPGLVLWDVGSGSGSVAIEAAGLIAPGVVYAIECKAQRIKNIEVNKERFKRSNIEIICANAPKGLGKLPDPDRVFIGGGGHALPGILKLVSKRLQSGGVIVVNAVTLETLTNASKFFKENGWSFEVVTINISQSRDIAGVKIMEAQNPVSVITAMRS